MHISLDSALGRQRRLNSVGESVLQIAPNAAAAYSLRSLTGGDPRVVRVRRSSNNAEQDFTSSEVSSGALTSFVNEIQTLGTVSNSVGNDGFTLTNKSSTGFTATTDTATGVCGWPYTAKAGDKITVSFDAVIRSGTPQFLPRRATALSSDNLASVVSDSAISVNSTASYLFEFTYDDDQAGSLTFSEGDDNADFDISNFKVTAFKGAGFVETWYDQSGNGNDVVQATAGSQPKIVSAGSLVTGGLRFDDAQKLETASTASFGDGTTLSTFITNSSDGDEASYLLRFVSNYIILNNSAGLRRVNAGTSANAGTVSGSEELWSTISTLNSSGGTSNFFVDGVLKSSADANIGTNTVSSKVLNIGGSSSGTHWNGTVNEVIFYDTDQTNNRIAIDANIGEHYSLDLPSGVDPRENQVDGFVETWYDQSGNSKDAIQTTANLQPAIVVAGVFQNGLKFDSDGSSSGPDFRTPISSAQLSNDPAGHSGFALVWVGNVNQVQHADTSNHSVLGNLRNVQSFPTGTIGLSVIPKTGTTKFINEQGGSTSETVQDTNALTPGDFGVVFFSFEDAESGLDPLLSVDGSTTTSSLNSLNSSSSNNIGIMTAINSNNTIRYDRSADGICKEVILYTGDQKSKRAALETNIAAEYGITLS